MKPYLLYSKPYYNGAEGADPRSGDTYRYCQLAKKNAYRIPKAFLDAYVLCLPPKCILIPVPEHRGNAEANLDLCNALKNAAGISKDVRRIDALRCDPHESLCEAKRQGKDTAGIDIRMHINTKETSREDLQMLNETFQIVLVDNVMDTGRTLRAAAEALGLEDVMAIALGYTGNDEGIYNPYRMLDTLTEALNDSYELDYVDYRDEYDAKTVEKCIQAKDLSPLYEGDTWDEATYQNAREIAKDVLAASDFDEEDQERFLDDELFIELVQEIEGRNTSTPEKDCFLQTAVHGRMTIHSNYDCWVPPYDAGCLYSKESLLWGLMAELCLNPKKVKEEVLRVWDVHVEGPWPDIKSRNGKEVVSYKDFVRVLYESPNYGVWTFLGAFDMQALLDDGFDAEKMVIPKGATCTMYNSWNGGGSCAFATTLRDLPVRELIRRAAPYQDGVRLHVDEKGCGSGYASNEVYAGHLSDDKFLI